MVGLGVVAVGLLLHVINARCVQPPACVRCPGGGATQGARGGCPDGAGVRGVSWGSGLHHPQDTPVRGCPGGVGVRGGQCPGGGATRPAPRETRRAP